LRKITIECAWLNCVKTKSASTTKEDPYPLALARRTPHHRPARWLTLSAKGEANAVAKKQHLTRRPNQAKITGRASLSPPVAKSLGLDISIESNTEERTDNKREEQQCQTWMCHQVRIELSSAHHHHQIRKHEHLKLPRRRLQEGNTADALPSPSP
jgi:hypothetical protein